MEPLRLMLLSLLWASVIALPVIFLAWESAGTASLVQRLRRPSGPPARKKPGSLLGLLVVLPTAALVLGLVSPVFDLAWNHVAGSLRALPPPGIRFAILPAWLIAAGGLTYAMKNPHWPRRRGLGAGGAGLMAFVMACSALGTAGLTVLHLAVPGTPLAGVVAVLCAGIAFFLVTGFAVTSLNLILFIAVLCRRPREVDQCLT
jgi:hypothetical protein